MKAEERRTVLVVEDEWLVCEVIASELTDAGYEVLEAGTGEEALAFLRGTARIDLLFTDIRLPGGIDGWGLAEEARRLRPSLPVIYTTGYTPDEPRLVPESLLVPKPYRPSAVLSAAEQVGVGPIAG